jgi:PPOX class probable F420-dependent enzyme
VPLPRFLGKSFVFKEVVAQEEQEVPGSNLGAPINFGRLGPSRCSGFRLRHHTPANRLKFQIQALTLNFVMMANNGRKGAFMGIALSNEIKQLVDRANFAHLATSLPDGSPHSAPVWIGRDGDTLLVCTEAGSLKGKNTLRDPRIALSIVDFVDPYSEVQIRGRVVERRSDAELKYFAAMSLKYVGKPWPYRDEKTPIVLIIEVTKALYAKQPFEHAPPRAV